MDRLWTYLKRSLRLALGFALFAAIGRLSADENGDAEGRDFFIQRVQPILESRCFSCHSHESGKMKGGLALDSRSGWGEGGGQGAAIIPGRPEESLLIKAVEYGDPDLQMPPKEKLPDDEIELLKEWVKRGAPDPRMTGMKPVLSAEAMDWWSLKALAQPPAPRTSNGANPIDAFVRDKLAGKGLKPAERADRRTQVRRLYFNLHGLPPTPEQVEAFVEDTSAPAYERLVDALLNSPRYGERWARHWLDAIHFADTHGCEHDALRPNAWRFRDYVIDSFNRDTPWARFIREQLAADVFFPDQPELTTALGFIGAGPFELSRFSTAPKTFAYLDRDDMVTQTMAAFASVTANCARCHDHKSDPITQEDYYALQAVFAGVGKGDVEYDEDLALHRSRKRWKQLARAVETDDADVLLEKENKALIAEWEKGFEGETVEWTVLRPETFIGKDGMASLKRLEDDSILAGDKVPVAEVYNVTATTSMTNITAIRLEVLPDDSLPEKGPGRNANGNLHLSGFEARVFKDGADGSQRLGFVRATSDWDQSGGYVVANAMDGKTNTSWAVYPRVGEAHQAVFELSKPIALKKPAKLAFTLKHQHLPKHVIGRFRLSVTGADGWRAQALPKLAEEGMKLPETERNEEQKLAIAKRAIWVRSNEELETLPAAQRVFAAAPEHFVEGRKHLFDEPKKVHVLKRGDIEQPGEEAKPGALAAIDLLPGRFELNEGRRESSRRAGLADWLAARGNPLTWRSVVNRVWHHHFGRGICDTPNDFGRMGGEPTHPELLDWLAVWFRDEAGGSLKALHRLILTSETYRQSSFSAGEAEGADAGNHWLSRMNRRRLDAEQFRDAVRQVSGRLDGRIGGPGVEQFTRKKGPQVSPVLDYGAFDWDKPEAARRSVYRIVWRGISDPFLEALDFPDLGLLAPKRGQSVSSLQSLAMFNNDFVLHHSDRLAKRIQYLCTAASRQASAAAKVRLAVRLTYQREPGKGELGVLTGFVEKHGMVALCRTLLNSNEFLFVD